MTFVKFKETYNIKTNFLSYQRVTSEIKSYLKLLNISSNDLQKSKWLLITKQYENILQIRKKLQRYV
jgi:hypothetical protein